MEQQKSIKGKSKKEQELDKGFDCIDELHKVNKKFKNIAALALTPKELQSFHSGTMDKTKDPFLKYQFKIYKYIWVNSDKFMSEERPFLGNFIDAVDYLLSHRAENFLMNYYCQKAAGYNKLLDGVEEEAGKIIKKLIPEIKSLYRQKFKEIEREKITNRKRKKRASSSEHESGDEEVASSLEKEISENLSRQAFDSKSQSFKQTTSIILNSLDQGSAKKSKLEIPSFDENHREKLSDPKEELSADTDYDVWEKFNIATQNGQPMHPSEWQKLIGYSFEEHSSSQTLGGLIKSLDKISPVEISDKSDQTKPLDSKTLTDRQKQFIWQDTPSDDDADNSLGATVSR